MLPPARWPMTYDLYDARQLRFRAEEMRCAAEAMLDPTCKQTALRMAEHYELLAFRAETNHSRRDQSKGSSGQRRISPL